MSKYEKQIKELCREIYGEEYYKEYTTDDLYKAWKLREYCPVEMFDEDNFKQSDEYVSSVIFKDRDGYRTAKCLPRICGDSADGLHYRALEQ